MTKERKKRAEHKRITFIRKIRKIKKKRVL